MTDSKYTRLAKCTGTLKTSITGFIGLDLVHASTYIYNYSKCLFQTDYLYIMDTHVQCAFYFVKFFIYFLMMGYIHRTTPLLTV